MAFAGVGLGSIMESGGDVCMTKSVRRNMAQGAGATARRAVRAKIEFINDRGEANLLP